MTSGVPPPGPPPIPARPPPLLSAPHQPSQLRRLIRMRPRGQEAARDLFRPLLWVGPPLCPTVRASDAPRPPQARVGPPSDLPAFGSTWLAALSTPAERRTPQA